MAHTTVAPAAATTKLDLSSDPTIKGKAGAVAWYRDVMGLSSVCNGPDYQSNQRPQLAELQDQRSRLVLHL